MSIRDVIIVHQSHSELRENMVTLCYEIVKCKQTGSVLAQVLN